MEEQSGKCEKKE
jgi:hypothetical protein